MIRIPLVKNQLSSRTAGLGIVAASVVVLVTSSLILFWGLNREGGSPPITGTVILEVSVPREIQLTEGSSGSTNDGTPLEISGDTALLEFREGYLEAVALPVFYQSDHILASFSNPGSGISLQQDDKGQQTLRFPLLSTQGGMPLTITGIVESIQPQDQGSRTRIALTRMKAEAEFPVAHTSDDWLPSIESVRLAFELHRLPEDARLKVTRIEEMDRSTRSTIDSALDDRLGPWSILLAIEAQRTNLENGEDVGEASLYLTLSRLSLESVESLVAVHLDEDGRAEGLAQEIVSALNDEYVVRFSSPRGLSIFAVMVFPAASSPGSER